MKLVSSLSAMLAAIIIINVAVAGGYCKLTIRNTTSENVTLYVTGNVTGFNKAIPLSILSNSSNDLYNIDQGNTVTITDDKGWQKTIRMNSDKTISYP